MTSTKRLNGGSGIDDNEGVDFERLDKEVNEAFERDARYWQENDAKLRALRQHVGSYEEFRQIVLASHLRPIEKDESLTDLKKKASIFNTVASASSESAEMRKGGGPADRKPSAAGQIQSKEDFIKRWKAEPNADGRWTLLSGCSIAELTNAFRVELPPTLFSEMLTCMNERLQAADAEHDAALAFILNLLIATPNFGRFAIVRTFLSASDKKQLESVLSCASSTQGPSAAARVQQIRTLFELK